MKKFVNRILHPTKTKLFWLYIVVGILLLILGIMLMPVWGKCPDWVFWKDWGLKIVSLLIGVCILAYLFLFLIKKVRQRANSVVQILTIIEFVVLALIAVGCVLQQFQVIKINGGACAILGLALWCRGVVEIFRAYYHQRGNNEYYPVWWLVIAIFLVSIGVYMFVAPFFQDIHILWIFVVLVLLLAIILIVDGILAKPVSTKPKKEKDQKKKKEKKKSKEESDEE